MIEDYIYVCGYCLQAGEDGLDVQHKYEECAAGDWIERKYIGN